MPPVWNGFPTGFTLLELLVVIMIFSILVGMVLPGLDGIRGHSLTDTAKRLCLLINHARQEAMLTSRPWRLEIDPGDRVVLRQAGRHWPEPRTYQGSENVGGRIRVYPATE